MWSGARKAIDSARPARMTVDEINDTLDAMAAKAAGGDPEQMPGLITFHTDVWVPMPRFASAKNMEDGMRYRDVRIHVGSQQKTAVLTRAEAGDRGEPYRDLMPRP